MKIIFISLLLLVDICSILTIILYYLDVNREFPETFIKYFEVSAMLLGIVSFGIIGFIFLFKLKKKIKKWRDNKMK